MNLNFQEFSKTFFKRHPDYVGNNVFCNICGTSFSHFAPVNCTGNPLFTRHNAFFPVCLTNERHRFIYPFLITLIKAQDRILHFAPEAGFYKYLSALSENYVPCDLEPDNYNFATNIQKIDITNITFTDNYFDVILCNHVLEHIPNDTLALKEIYRVLKSQGKALISVPLFNKAFEDPTITSPEDRKHYFYQEDHVRAYNFDLINSRLLSTGFKVNYYSSAKLPLFYQQQLALDNKSEGQKYMPKEHRNSIFVCEKVS